MQSKEQTCLLPCVIKIASSSGAKHSRLTDHYEDLGSLSQKFLSCGLTNTVSRCHLDLFMLPVGLGTCTNADALAAAFGVSNKVSFAFDPGISWVLPTAMKLGQANLLTCK